MPRFLTDDTFDDDPAVLRAGTAAMGLYYRCGVYVARHLLDGFVPTEVAVQYGTPEWAKRLTDACLWEIKGGQYYMPLYFAHGNPTREKVLADRKAKSDRQQRWLEKQRKPSPEPRRVSRRSNNAPSVASADGSKDSALPPSLTGRKGDAAHASLGAAASPTPIGAGGRHEFIPDHSGDCAECQLPEGNRVHQRRAS